MRKRGTREVAESAKAGGRIYRGWFVVGVAFLVMFVNYGVRSTQTVLIKGFSSELDIGRAAASLPFTVCVLVYAFLAPVTGRLIDRFGPRWVMVGGAFLSGLGLWMCSRVHSLVGLVFFFGVLFGIGGNGIGLVPSNTSVAMWFRRRLGLALGLATMGIGFGTMILPRLTGVVQAHHGWRASFQFLGYVAMALVLPAFFFLRGGKGGGEEPEGEEAAVSGGAGEGAEDAKGGPTKVGEEKEKPQSAGGFTPGMMRGNGSEEPLRGDAVRYGRIRKGGGAGAVSHEVSGGGAADRGTGGEIPEGGIEGDVPHNVAGGAAPKGGTRSAASPGGLTLREALRTASFWYLFWGFVLIVVALYGIMVHQVPYATDKGVSRNWAEWSVVLYGATSILGRFYFGRLSDRTREKKNALYPACFILAAAILLLFLVDRAWLLMVFAAVFGFGFAAYGPVIPAACAEVFGKENLGAIFGAVTTGGALGGAAGPVVTGFVFDRSGSYLGAWVLALACVLVSTLLFSRVRTVRAEGVEAKTAGLQN